MRELTPIQAAYWVGRQSGAALGGVAAHLYAEFDSVGLSVDRLRMAVKRLYDAHPMLRLRITDEGLQTVEAPCDRHELHVDDMREFSQEESERSLTTKRLAKTNQQLDLYRGQAADLSLSLLPGERRRLHVDTDMIAVDPPSFRLLMEDLARFYEEPRQLAQASSCYFDYLERMRSDADLNLRRERDRNWWRPRIGQIPPAPPLPRSAHGASTVLSKSFAAQLGPEERRVFERTARKHRLTPSMLALGLFAGLLGAGTGAARFRLNAPMFQRNGYVEGVDQIIGEFSNLLILSVDLKEGESLGALCARLAEETTQLISHSGYPGVSVMRDLSRRHGGMELAPVVFTAGLDIGGELFSEGVTRLFGEMSWVISQAPQVALDAQIVSAYGGILINWDVRLDAIPKSWIEDMFEAYVASIRHIARAPEVIEQPFDQFLSRLNGKNAASVERRNGNAVAARLIDRKGVATTNSLGDGELSSASEGKIMERALTPLQQAYLLGRSEHLPLGGVAMQEFREYRGRIEADELRRRLHELVRRHECLRTRIDPHRLTQSVSEKPVVNLEEVDLRGLSSAEASERIDALREEYAHRLHDLRLSPWRMLMFRLPEGEGSDAYNCAIFACFDALIMDGRSIATIMVELFDANKGGKLRPAALLGQQNSAAIAPQRSEDAAYWTQKLHAIAGPPRLPWKRPLETITVSRYARDTLTISRADFAKLAKIGASQNLFRNSILSAAILETLSRWMSEGALCVGVPVAPPTGDMGNASTFIAVNYDLREGSFLERARLLQEDTLEALEHLSFSGVDINRLLLSRNGGGVALPMIVTNGLSWETLGDDSPIRLHAGLTQTPQVAMDIRMSLDEGGNLLLCVDYARQAIDKEVVRDILQAIDKTIGAVCRRGALEVKAQDFLDYAHYRYNGAESDFVCSGFLERIARNLFGGALAKNALVCGDRRISYSELGQSVARVMQSLRDRGLARGKVVAICLPRSPEHVMVSVACSLMGIIWVPVDASSPPERMRYLLENCLPDLVVSLGEIDKVDAVTPQRLLDAKAIDDQARIIESLSELSQSDDPAYYLYTSGTTGKPKCVSLSNKATSNVIGRTLEEWRIDAADVFISVTPLHHDMSVFDVFGSLTAGATLVIPGPGEDKDAIRWSQLVKEHCVSIWSSVPAILEMLLSCSCGDELRSLKLIAQGGDYIKPAVIAQLRRLDPNLRLFSLGGPTETTIWSIWHEITDADIDVIPYGRPLPANRYFVVNEANDHCPPQVVGRIYTAGVNVAIGYLENGVVNQNDFVTIADEQGKPVRAFRTCDQGYYRKDGVLIFASRISGYVKVRGVRVSLPDIENELTGHDSIKQALVVDYGAEKMGEAAIGALYVAKNDVEIPAAELRSFARLHLPESHIPTRFLRVQELPLSANGKPDRRQARELLAVSQDAERAETKRGVALEGVSPHGDRILEIYQSVIGVSSRDAPAESADFLTMGLLPSHLKKIASRINEEFGVDLSPALLVRCRNARQVAQLFS
ncbi:amino acid adenylation domain-containing protein [Methylocystis sp. 9N]|uniref:Amino acid adenylation domain-containing protein n=1 Tax=Methylocystis borbori TaxID=3118750 RepID=A0ABU7XCD1_9HYPH